MAWERLDATLHPYHWDDREKYYRDYAYLADLYERLLREVSERLGALHATTADVRHWRLIVGPWLRFFGDALFDRFECVRTAAEGGGWQDTLVLRHDRPAWRATDFRHFFRQFTGDGWNHVAFASCVRAMGLPSTPGPADLAPVPGHAPSPPGIRQIVRAAVDAGGRLLPPALNGVVIVGANLPKRRVFRLQAALGQAPYVKAPDVLPPAGHDTGPRRDLAVALGESVFERLLADLVQEWMPRAYVEDFAQVSAMATARYPRRPKVIFTETSFQGEDGFNTWAARHVARGVPLVIGQHGGNMGLARVSQSEDHQIRAADVFASWGWRSSHRPAVRPLPALRLVADEPDPPVRADGDILILMTSYPRYFYCHYAVPVAGQVLAYVLDQVRLVELLGTDLAAAVKVRMDGDTFGWDTTQVFRERGLAAMLEPVDGPLAQRLRSCRLAISTYNATSLLETMAADFPTVVVLNPHHFETRVAAAADLDRLRAVGILHATPESAARHVRAVASDIPAWWGQGELQAVRRAFCDRYARRSAQWTAEWVSLFRSLAATSGHAVPTRAVDPS